MKLKSCSVYFSALFLLFHAQLPAQADTSHGLTLVPPLKYKQGFKHFDYVNPQAPKGGLLRRGAVGTFDSLNPFISKGQAASLTYLIYDTLMTSSADEPSSEYGLLAEAVSYPENYGSVTYTLRKNARWHDGKPVTPEDVIFSLEVLKKGNPTYDFYYRDITVVKKIGPHKVKFYFDKTGNKELPLITGQMPIIPKHFWEGTDAAGEKRDFFSTKLIPPLGSGPYKIGRVDAGKSISVKRVENYWGKKLNVNIGRYNFDEIRTEYFRDDTVALEAFKGDQFDVRIESSSKNWNKSYDFKAVRDGQVIAEVFTDKNVAPMQAFIFNTRKSKFSDRRVRRAFNYAFDFEWANKNLFFGQYTRTDSFFDNSEMAASGLPDGLELKILKGLKSPVPEEIFTTPYQNPVSANQKQIRSNLRKAIELFKEAGWGIKAGKLIHQKSGEEMEVEFLLRSPSFERVVLPYSKALKRLGITSKIRTVDSPQYTNRVKEFNFDIIVGGWGQSLSPGNEQRNYWSSSSADRKSSRNYAGIKNKAIDELITKIIFASSRQELVASTRALDRLLLWGNYVVPQWHFIGTRLARWNRFGIPANRPQYQLGYPHTWWYDRAKADQIKDK